MGNFFSALSNGWHDLTNNFTGAIWDSLVVTGLTFVLLVVLRNSLPGDAWTMFTDVNFWGLISFAVGHMLVGLVVNSAYDFVTYAAKL